MYYEQGSISAERLDLFVRSAAHSADERRIADDLLGKHWRSGEITQYSGQYAYCSYSSAAVHDRLR